MSSEIPTAWAVYCPNHKKVYLTHEEYMSQMMSPNSLWSCPDCGYRASWDDANYDEWMEAGAPA